MQIVLSTVETKWLDDNRAELSRQALLRKILQEKINTTANTGANNETKEQYTNPRS